ncbi:hypothetical protein LCGC14_2030190 [marine sediment metagenome]|uniref:Uncharacterized protein n=1 Tax=marine sediment metagenome TaxID=412755 RepID=A0A0F9FHI0_9ZZZZ
MTERKATITVTGEVSEKDFEKLVGLAATAVAEGPPEMFVSIGKSQTPGGEFDNDYEIKVTVPEPEPEEAP